MCHINCKVDVLFSLLWAPTMNHIWWVGLLSWLRFLWQLTTTSANKHAAAELGRNTLIAVCGLPFKKLNNFPAFFQHFCFFCFFFLKQVYRDSLFINAHKYFNQWKTKYTKNCKQETTFTVLVVLKFRLQLFC